MSAGDSFLSIAGVTGKNHQTAFADVVGESVVGDYLEGNIQNILIERADDPTRKGAPAHTGDDDVFGEVTLGVECLITALNPRLLDLIWQAKNRLVDLGTVELVDSRLVES